MAAETVALITLAAVLAALGLAAEYRLWRRKTPTLQNRDEGRPMSTCDLTPSLFAPDPKNEISPFCDLMGRPIERTPASHPYAFDTYVQWEHPFIPASVVDSDAYSDRMYSAAPELFNSCHEQVWGNDGQFFDGKEDGNPTKIQEFLRLYVGNQDLVLINVQKGCNHGSGQPIWLFGYASKLVNGSCEEFRAETSVEPITIGGMKVERGRTTFGQFPFIRWVDAYDAHHSLTYQPYCHSVSWSCIPQGKTEATGANIAVSIDLARSMFRQEWLDALIGARRG